MVTTEVAPGLWLFSPGGDSLLPENSFLLRLGQSAEDGFLLFDPTPDLDLQLVIETLKDHGSGLEKLLAVALTHDDFDVFETLPRLASSLPAHTLFLTSEEFFKMGSMAGIGRERVLFPERYLGGLRLEGASGALHFSSIPYCHAPSAFVSYAPWLGCVFTGELLGGLVLEASPDEPFADERSWRGIELYHERHIPSTQALKNAVQAVRRLQPKMACPLQGRLLRGSVLEATLDGLLRVSAGADLLASQTLDSGQESVYSQFLEEVLTLAERRVGRSREGLLAGSPSLKEVISAPEDWLKGSNASPGRLLETLLLVLTDGEDEAIASSLARELIARSDELGLRSLTGFLAG